MFKHMLWFLFAGPIAFIQFAVSSEAPCSAGAHYPELLRGEIPLYPPIARSAHITGTVVIEVTVERGSVTGARLTSESNPYLANPSLANVKAWQFQPEDRTTFLLEYVYQIRGEETLLPENPRVELDLPCRVKVTASPFKPTETYGSTDSNAPDPVKPEGGRSPAVPSERTFSPGHSARPSQEVSSLCSLRSRVSEGTRIEATVAGVYSEGPENTTLSDADCPEERTWVEFDLTTKEKEDTLHALLAESGRAFVIFEGDFFGPPLPNKGVPESLRERFQPRWGHLSCCATKFVVHVIREVRAVRSEGGAPVDAPDQKPL